MSSTKHRPEEVIEKIESAVDSLSMTLEELKASVDLLKKNKALKLLEENSPLEGVDNE